MDPCHKPLNDFHSGSSSAALLENHPARWDEYRHRHAAELMERRQSLDALHDALRKGPVTRLTASRNPCCNHAVALLDIADSLA